MSSSPRNNKPSNNNSDESKARKIPFTLRLEENLLERLEYISINSSKAAVARNYLNLSNYLVVNPDLTIEYPDGTQLMMMPKNMIKDLISNLKRDTMLEFGNELGRIFNTNCSIRQIQTISNKIKYLQTIGWFDIKLIPKKDKNGTNWIHYGILAKYWPLDLIHAFLYRILHNHQYPYAWQIEKYKEMLSLSDKKLKTEKKNVRNDPTFKKHPNMIEEFKEFLGGHFDNFNEDCVYYLFDRLAMKQIP